MVTDKFSPEELEAADVLSNKAVGQIQNIACAGEDYWSNVAIIIRDTVRAGIAYARRTQQTGDDELDRFIKILKQVPLGISGMREAFEKQFPQGSIITADQMFTGGYVAGRNSRQVVSEEELDAIARALVDKHVDTPVEDLDEDAISCWKCFRKGSKVGFREACRRNAVVEKK